MLCLRERIALVERNLASCTLCPLDCHVDRLRGETGYCGLTAEGRVFHHYLSFSEEWEISPTYEVLFSGCSHRCRFCSVLDHVVEPGRGRAAGPAEVQRGIADAAARGLKTVSFVGGEPTVNLLAILRLIEAIDLRLPIVWNSNMFLGPVAHQALRGLVDTFVGDVHFGNERCARAVGGVPFYFAAVTGSFEQAVGYANVIVRHLLLPGHLECCFEPIAQWASTQLPRLRFHLLDGFLPSGRGGALDRALPSAEARHARGRLRQLGLHADRCAG